LDVGYQIQYAAVFEKASPLGIERNQLHVVFELAIGFVEDSLQDRWQCQNGGAHVESEPILLVDSRLATNPFILFQQGDSMTAGRKGASGGESGESSADDSHVQRTTVLLDHDKPQSPICVGYFLFCIAKIA
jgi:hypothetical protein